MRNNLLGHAKRSLERLAKTRACDTGNVLRGRAAADKYAGAREGLSYSCQTCSCGVVYRTQSVPCISASANMLMKAGVPSTAVLVAMLVLLCQPLPSDAGGIDALLPILTNQLVSLFQTNELQFMGFQCFYNQYPRIKKWQLYFKGSFSCPGWTGIRGKAETRSRSGVMKSTIENFLERVSAANLVTEEEANAWLAGY